MIALAFLFVETMTSNAGKNVKARDVAARTLRDSVMRGKEIAMKIGNVKAL